MESEKKCARQYVGLRGIPIEFKVGSTKSLRKTNSRYYYYFRTCKYQNPRF